MCAYAHGSRRLYRLEREPDRGDLATLLWASLTRLQDLAAGNVEAQLGGTPP